MDNLKFAITHPFALVWATVQAFGGVLLGLIGMAIIFALHVLIFGGIALVMFAILKWAFTTVFS